VISDRGTAQQVPSRGRAVVLFGRVVIGLLLPLVVYYGLRELDVDVYLALLASTLVSAVPTAVSLVRRRRLNPLSAYFTAMLLGSVVVSLLAGSTQFLLAKEAVLTGVTGGWFLASAAVGRPLSYLFSRPMLEGRFRWPARWDSLWARSPRWRRMWRVSSVLFGIGALLDAVLRVVFAYTLPPDVVPATATAMFGITSVVLIVVTNAYYLCCGVFDRRSALYRRSMTAVCDQPAGVVPGPPMR